MEDPPKDLYIITTARKRDTLEWEGELPQFLMSTHGENNLYSNTVTIDSWNNIGKYADVEGAFFIFDEQRVIGSGAWVKSFLKIAKVNEWILLSATPGDTWMDYIPVFIANGFYKNRSEFIREHVVYNRVCKFPKVDRYLNTGRLIKYRNQILINMDFHRETVAHHEDVKVPYDILQYKEVGTPIKTSRSSTPESSAMSGAGSSTQIQRDRRPCWIFLRSIRSSSSFTTSTMNLIFCGTSTMATMWRLPNGTVTTIRNCPTPSDGYIWCSIRPGARGGTV